MDNKILMIGIGNKGRSDDAAGWKFADHFYDWNDLFDIEYRYQLQIEDALLITSYQKVIFVDASSKPFNNGFSFYKGLPLRTESFTSHKLEPETVLWLANELFNITPEAYVMAITGTIWDLHHGLSDVAQQNLNQAVSHFTKWLATVVPYVQ